MAHFAILLVLLLYLPTISSQLYERDLCGKGQEMVCLVQKLCKGGGTSEEEMDVDDKVATNYKEDPHCPVHVMIKKYNISSYFVRFITTNHLIKLTTAEGISFGCQLNQEEMKLLKSDNMAINLVNFSTPTGTRNEILCEITVAHATKEIFTKNMQITVEVDKTTSPLTIASFSVFAKLDYSQYTCDPSKIELGGSHFTEGGFAISNSLDTRLRNITCPDNYSIAFEDKDGTISSAESISCEKEAGCNVDCKTWKYSIREKGKTNNVQRDSFKAVCRAKVCKLCGKPSLSCSGEDCVKPEFNRGKEEECNTLMCPEAKGENSIVRIGKGKKTIGQFECIQDEKEKNFEWTFAGKPFQPASATCYDKIDCNDLTTLKLECKRGRDDCPDIDADNNEVICGDGFTLSLTDRSNGEEIRPSKILCNHTSKIQVYTEGEAPTKLDMSKYKVACARKAAAASAAGNGLMYILLGLLVLALIGVPACIVVHCCLVRRKKKAKQEEETKKLLTKKNDSQPSTSEAGRQPQPVSSGPVPVLIPIPTPSSSNEKMSGSEASNEKKTNELPEKTMIEPTVTVNTAFSRETHSVHKSKDVSLENEGDATRGRKDEEKTMHEKDEAASVQGSHVSKKEGKDDKKQPRKFDLNDKERKIAKGVYRRNEDYPTMADIESDWDDAKDGKHVSKQKTATKDIPTAKTPSVKEKAAELNEKTAEFEKLMVAPNDSDTKVIGQKGEEKGEDERQQSQSRGSVRRKNNFANILTTLEETQDQK